MEIKENWRMCSRPPLKAAPRQLPSSFSILCHEKLHEAAQFAQWMSRKDFIGPLQLQQIHRDPFLEIRAVGIGAKTAIGRHRGATERSADEIEKLLK